MNSPVSQLQLDVSVEYVSNFGLCYVSVLHLCLSGFHFYLQLACNMPHCEAVRPLLGAGKAEA